MMATACLVRIVSRVKRERERDKRENNARKIFCRMLATEPGKMQEKVGMTGYPILKCKYLANIKAIMTSKLHQFDEI